MREGANAGTGVGADGKEPYFLSGHHSLPSLTHLVFQADFTALRIFGVVPFVTGEGDDRGNACRPAGFDCLRGGRDHLFVITRVVEPLHERRARHSVGRHRAAQAVLFQSRPFVRAADFDRLAAEIPGDGTGLVDAPLVTSDVKAPENNRVFDVALEIHDFGLHDVGWVGRAIAVVIAMVEWMKNCCESLNTASSPIADAIGRGRVVCDQLDTLDSRRRARRSKKLGGFEQHFAGWAGVGRVVEFTDGPQQAARYQIEVASVTDRGIVVAERRGEEQRDTGRR